MKIASKSCFEREGGENARRSKKKCNFDFQFLSGAYFIKNYARNSQ